jgi:hypothetical protein
MKKIIPFIASNYRQDKIWLRRTLPYNRDYYITISIDNSLSMKQNNIGYYALQSMLILIKSLQKVGIDNLSLYGITDDCVELYDYNREKNLINNDKIKKILNYFKFNFESKNSFDYSIRNFLNKSIQNIENNKNSKNKENKKKDKKETKSSINSSKKIYLNKICNKELFSILGIESHREEQIDITDYINQINGLQNKIEEKNKYIDLLENEKNNNSKTQVISDTGNFQIT